MTMNDHAHAPREDCRWPMTAHSDTCVEASLEARGVVDPIAEAAIVERLEADREAGRL